MIARPFRHEAENRRLQFEVELSPHVERSITTDLKRLQQVLKNLLSNAFKFTAEGGVKLKVSPAIERLERGSSDPAPRRLGGRLRGVRHRHRHPAREAAHHLRGLPAGRCGHQPQIRRHRPRARDQPRARQSARRRDPAALDARASGSVFTLYLPITYMGSAAREAPSGARHGAAVGRSRRVDVLDRARRSGRRSRSPTTATPSRPARAWCSSSRTTRISRAS